MENRQALADAARAIASHLGWDWSFDEAWFADNTAARIAGPNGAYVHLRPNTYEYEPANGTRLEISGSFPHSKYGSHAPYNGCPHITVSAAKSPHAIANDIRKRFLPRYMPLYHEALERKQSYEEGEQLQAAVAQQLADLMGGSVGREGRVFRPSHLDGYGHIEVQHGGDAVNFKLSSIPLDLALQIATILGEGERGE